MSRREELDKLIASVNVGDARRAELDVIIQKVNSGQQPSASATASTPLNYTRRGDIGMSSTASEGSGEFFKRLAEDIKTPTPRGQMTEWGYTGAGRDSISTGSEFQQGLDNLTYGSLAQGAANQYLGVSRAVDIARATPTPRGQMTEWGYTGAGRDAIPVQSNQIGEPKKSRITEALERSASNVAASRAKGEEATGAHPFVGDALSTIGQIGSAAPLGAGGYLAVAGVSNFGNSYDAAIKHGATHEDALKYAAANAAVQTAIERAGGIGGGAFGAKVSAKLLPGQLGGTVAGGLIKNIAGEAAEEMAGYEAERRLGNAILDSGQEFSLKDMLYQGALGAFGGGAFGAANIVAGRPAQSKAQVEAQEQFRQAMLKAGYNEEAAARILGKEASATLQEVQSTPDYVEAPIVGDINAPKSIKQQVNDNLATINNNNYITNITTKDIPRDKNGIKEYALKIFNNLGNKVFRNGFGEVILNKQGIRNSLSYDSSLPKAAAFAAVPDVIAYGNEISNSSAWKGRQYDTHTFAGRVSIDGREGVVAAVVRKTAGENRYYVHKVYDMDGNVFTFGEDAKTQVDAPAEDTINGEQLHNQPVFNTIIPQTPNDVNAWHFNDQGGEQAVSRVRSNTMEYSGIFNEVEKQIAGLRPEDMTYDMVTEQESIARARQRLDQDAVGEAEYLRSKEAWSGEDLDTAMGILYHLRNQARQSGDYQGVAEWSQLIQRHGTAGGQFIQAFAKYTRTPDGVLVKAADTLAKTNLSSTEKNVLMDQMGNFAQTLEVLKNGSPDTLVQLIEQQAVVRRTKVSEATRKALKAQNVQYLYDFALTQFENMATDYNKVSAGQKISTYQAVSHLLNAKTMLRNIVSNQTFDIIDSTAQNLGRIPDAILGTITGQRTVGVNRSWFSKAKRQGALENARRAWAEVALDVDASKAQTKYGTGARRTFKAKDSRVMSRLEKAMGFGLNVTDEFHKGSVRAEVMESLQPFVDKGLLTQEQASGMADREALYRSFQDETLPGQILQGLKDTMNLVGTGDSGKRRGQMVVHEFGAGDLVQKYTQVPGALLSRAVEFSPAGYVKAAATLAQAKGIKNLTPEAQRKVALNISRATTGTGLITVFGALAAKGLLHFMYDEEDKNLAALYRAAGLSGVQLNISGVGRWLDGGNSERQNGDTLVSVEFLEPLNSLMNIGALVARSDEALPIALMNGTPEGIFNAFREIPTMQMLSSLYNTIQYHDDESDLPLVAEIPIELARGSISGFVPGPVRQLGQATDPVYRDTSGNNSSEQLLRGLQGSIPGLREQLPEKITGLGTVQTAGDNKAVNWLNALVSPGRVATYQETPVMSEIMRIYEETGSNSILPRRNAPNQFTNDGTTYEMSVDEKRQYLKTSGQAYSKALLELIKSPEYKQAAAEEQVKMLSAIKTYANDKAKAEYLAGQSVSYTSDKWINQVRELEKAGISNGEAILFRSVLNSIEDNNKKREYLNSITWLSSQKKAALDKAFINDGTYIPKEVNADYSSKESFLITQLSAGGQKRWPQAKAAGMSAEMYARLYPIAASSSLKKDERIAQLMAAGFTRQQADYFYRLVNSN